MSAFEWSISGPIDTSWTPAEFAQIARAAQAFMAALPNPQGRTVHLVRLDGLDVLGPEFPVTWPQPEAGMIAPSAEVMKLAEMHDAEPPPEPFSVSRKGTVWPIPGVPWVRSTETEFAEFARCSKTLALSEQLLRCTLIAGHDDSDCAFA